MTKDQAFLLALNRHSGLGSRRLRALKSQYKNWESVWNANLKDIARTLGNEIADSVAEAHKLYKPDNEMRIVENVGVNIIELGTPEYPSLLAELSDPPVVIYCKGSVESLSSVCVSVVGSRRATQYGYSVTESIVRPLVRYGISIVSGLALGIDTAAHKAAVEAEGKTIGVLACGLDQIYPVANAQLGQKMLDCGGAIISEFAPGIPPSRSNFPVRNRIIAGLSPLTIVVEALESSGALITAKAALEYNREVGAVPGDIHRPQAKGPLNLIKMGALPITSADDVLEILGQVPGVEEQKQEVIGLSAEEKKVLEGLSREPINVDKLSKQVKLDISALNSILVMLELKGAIKNLGGNQYIKK
jgi:DNA processing protein